MEVNVLGKHYKVIRADTRRDKERWAEINYVTQVIEIDKDLSDERAKECLIHEILHGILADLEFRDENENEHLVQCLASSMYQVLKENNNLDII